MKYKFALCQMHPKLPDLQGWCLVLHPDDPETLMKVHSGVCYLYYAKFGMNPHFDPNGPYNPIKLAAQWLLSVERYLLAGTTIVVNINGGIIPLEDIIVLETVESDNLRWNKRFDDEVITVSKWPDGTHYYLCSNKDRIFIPSKYNKFDDAYQEALRYVPEDRIKSKE